jgi:hypothetical protein
VNFAMDAYSLGIPAGRLRMLSAVETVRSHGVPEQLFSRETVTWIYRISSKMGGVKGNLE